MSIEKQRKAPASAALEARSSRTAETVRESAIAPGPTLQELKSTPEFTHFMESHMEEDFVDVGARWMKNEATSDDLQMLANVRAEYLERTRKLDGIRAVIDGRFASVRRHSPAIDTICALHGEQAFRSALELALREITYTRRDDPANTAFIRIAEALESIHTSERQITDPESPVNRKITAFLENNPAIAQDKLNDALVPTNQVARVTRTESLLREQMGRFKRGFDTLRTLLGSKQSSHAKALEMSHAMTSIENMQDQVDDALRGFGSLLGKLITRNPEHLVALQRAAAGEAPVLRDSLDTKMTFSTAQERARDIAKGADPAKMHQAFDAWLDKLGPNARRRTLAMSPEAFARRADEFVRDYVAENFTKKDGFWATVLGWLFSVEFKKKGAETLRNTIIPKK